ncbi:hypothetical protein CMT42_15060 [Elizabethkingia anophelis]|nr:hypothetical protein [Elizabethkingia anophelis]MDV3920674.1 hypothetical protein [Elizabethkingia anophelis]MDV3935037.1 hypothetical protein [Elizabethkingia anophelis]MDV3959240.1 hypothetical protein [Elizabethkingia anophelis]MDV3965494.1 hypothetical protein [Elizabethkingia anophelis]
MRRLVAVISYQLSVVSYQLSVVSYQLSVVSCRLSTINHQPSTIKSDNRQGKYPGSWRQNLTHYILV